MAEQTKAEQSKSIDTTNEQAILEHLKGIAKEQLDLTAEQLAAIQLDAPVLDALRLDSLAQVVLMAAIESDYGVTFEPEELQDVQSVRDLVALIVRHVSKGQPAQ